ncbi:hypothetical protein [Micromonospora sp. NPDC005189]|uniref:hypothetical protein n=1 Tax=unclassified Micromonospora TaxID=2617518 RepID=UPI0033BFACD0
MIAVHRSMAADAGRPQPVALPQPVVDDAFEVVAVEGGCVGEVAVVWIDLGRRSVGSQNDLESVFGLPAQLHSTMTYTCWSWKLSRSTATKRAAKAATCGYDHAGLSNEDGNIGPTP